MASDQTRPTGRPYRCGACGKDVSTVVSKDYGADVRCLACAPGSASPPARGADPAKLWGVYDACPLCRTSAERIKDLEADVSIRDGALEDQTRRTDAAEARAEAAERQADRLASELASAEKSLGQSESALSALGAGVRGFVQAVDAACAAAKAPRTGMRVPFHGDFVNAPPSVRAALKRWARDLRSLLGGGDAQKENER